MRASRGNSSSNAGVRNRSAAARHVIPSRSHMRNTPTRSIISPRNWRSPVAVACRHAGINWCRRARASAILRWRCRLRTGSRSASSRRQCSLTKGCRRRTASFRSSGVSNPSSARSPSTRSRVSVDSSTSSTRSVSTQSKTARSRSRRGPGPRGGAAGARRGSFE